MNNINFVKDGLIFLDYQASTPTDPKVLEKMLPYFSEYFANPHSSDHFSGWESKKSVEESRQKVAKGIQADPDEIVFTSGASEANNLALKGLTHALRKTGKNKIIVSEIEHKCVLESARYLEQEGFGVHYLKPNQHGTISPDDLEAALDERTGLVSIMLVNNEIGTIQPIKALTEKAKRAGALFHTDAAQAPAFMPLDVEELGIDLLSLSSHKVYGPKGIGALYISRHIQEYITPLIHGGGQENGLRSGTLPTALCVGFGEAMKLAAQSASVNALRLQELSNLFLSELQKHGIEFEINGATGDNRHPGNLNIRLTGINAQSFLQSLQPMIAASTGSACNSGIEAPSYVLEAIGLTREAASESIRFSFGTKQSNEEIIRAAQILKERYWQHKALAA